MDWRPTATVATLRHRAAMLALLRGFFAERCVLEVDTPVLQGGANLDPGITPLRVEADGRLRFLPTSPEHPLKRLVAAGCGAVWTLAPAFRRGEFGRRHAPEFRMLEWYRPGWDDHALCSEVIALLAALTGWSPQHELLTYRAAMRQHAGFDPVVDDDAALAVCLGDAAGIVRGDRQAGLDLLHATRVEPRLGQGRWTVLTDWPIALAAQARVRQDPDGHAVAARFEIYRSGVELANGYWELDDADELARRLEHERSQRAPDLGLIHDSGFTAAMRHGLGDCAGVAVGFDRVVMLALGLGSLAETQAFGWERA